MPVTLDATIGGAQSNAYADVAAADAYFASRLSASVWTALTNAGDTAKKRQGLITATNRLEQLHYGGTPVSSTQRLAHPRHGLVDSNGVLVPSTVIALGVRYALFETTLDFLTKDADVGATDALSKFSAIKVGSIAIQLRETAPTNQDQLRDVVWRHLGPFLDAGTSFDRG